MGMQFQDLFWMPKHMLGTFYVVLNETHFIFFGKNLGKMRVKQLMEAKNVYKR